jgi:hypothetical protein
MLHLSPFLCNFNDKWRNHKQEQISENSVKN